MVTNLVNGKKYIGQTIRTVEDRWKQHIRNARLSNQNAHYFQYAIRKYGPENFKVEVLEECPKEELDEKEMYYIKKYNTYEDGYNLSLGGEGGGCKYNYDQIKQYYKEEGSALAVSKKYNISRDTIAKALRATKVSSYGVKYTPLLMLDKTDFHIVKKFSNFYEASHFLQDEGYSKGKLNGILARLHEVCRGDRLSAYGFCWVKEEDWYEGYSVEKHIPGNCRPVYKLSEDDVILDVYISVNEAARENNIHQSDIRSVCLHKPHRITAGGYKWMYEEEYNELQNKNAEKP